MATKQQVFVNEKEVQRTLVEYLRWTGWRVFEFAKPGGHKALAAAVPPGWPDVVAIKGGRHLYVEVKTTWGRLSHDQVLLHIELRAAGCDVDTLYGMAGVDRLIAELEKEAR